MIAILSVLPLGKAGGLTKAVAALVDEIDRSGLDYQLTSMGTLIEGDWDPVMRLVKRVRDKALAKNGRIYLTLAIDDRKGARGRLAGKTASVRRALDRPLRS